MNLRKLIKGKGTELIYTFNISAIFFFYYIVKILKVNIRSVLKFFSENC